MERLDCSGLLFPSLHPSPSGSLPRREKKPTPKMKERRSILLLPQYLPGDGFTRKVRLNLLDDVTTQATYDQPLHLPNKVDCLRRSRSALLRSRRVSTVGRRGDPAPLRNPKGVGDATPAVGFGAKPQYIALNFWSLSLLESVFPLIGFLKDDILHPFLFLY